MRTGVDNSVVSGKKFAILPWHELHSMHRKAGNAIEDTRRSVDSSFSLSPHAFMGSDKSHMTRMWGDDF